MPLPGRSVLIDRGHIARGVFEFLDAHDQHTVVTARLDFRHGRQHAQRRRSAGPFMAHGRDTPEFGCHLGHHGAQVGLLALQFGECIAHVDALDGRGVQLGILQHALSGFLHHV